MALTIGLFAFYCVLMIAIGIYTTKFAKSYEDFMIGSSTRVAWLPMALSMMGTQLSGAVFLGTVGAVFQHGLASVMYVLVPFFIAQTLTWLFLSAKLFKLSNKVKLMTVPDFIEVRYESKKARLIFALIILIAYIPYIGSQLMGSSYLLGYVLNISYESALIISAIVVTIYLSFSGYLADVWTDTFQGAWMVLCWLVVLPFTFIKFGGLKGLFQAVGSVEPALLSWEGALGFYTPSMAISFFIFGVMATIAQPLNLFRFYSMKDEKTIGKAAFTCQATTFWIYFCIIVVALAARVLVPEVVDMTGGADYAAIHLANNFLPPIAGAILLVGIMGAMMSTVDGMMFIVGATFTRDIIQSVINPNIKERVLRWLGAVAIVISSALAVLVVYDPNAPFIHGILLLVFLSWGFLGISFLAPTVLGLYWRKMNTAGAIASSVLGAITYVLFWPGIIFKDYVWGVHPWIPAIVVAIVALLIGVRFGKPNSSEVINLFFEDAAKGKNAKDRVDSIAT